MAAIIRMAPGAVSVGELENAWPGRVDEAGAAVLDLVWRGVFDADLPVPLSAATRLERAS